MKWTPLVLGIVCAWNAWGDPPALTAKPDDFNYQVRTMAPTVKALDEGTLSFLVNAGAWIQKYVGAPVPFSGAVNGVQFLRFEMEPGEELKFTLAGEASKIVMIGCMPAKTQAMTSVIKAANMPVWSARCTNYRVKNVTKEKYGFDLILYGVCGYKYHLEIQHNTKP